MSTRRDSLVGTIFVLAAITAWGLYFPYAKLILQKLSPTVFVVFRFGIGLLVLLALSVRLRKSFREPSAGACLELAEWCREQGLLRDVNFQYYRVLALEPANATAHEALGHFQRRGQWMVKVGNGGVVRVRRA